MSDRSGIERGPSEGLGAFDDDPFADLARLIDEPWSPSMPAIPPKAPAKTIAPAPVEAVRPAPPERSRATPAPARKAIEPAPAPSRVEPGLRPDVASPSRMSDTSEAAAIGALTSIAGDRAGANDASPERALPDRSAAKGGAQDIFAQARNAPVSPPVAPNVPVAETFDDGDEFDIDLLLAGELDAEFAAFTADGRVDAPIAVEPATAPSVKPAATAPMATPPASRPVATEQVAARSARPVFGSAMLGAQPAPRAARAPAIEKPAEPLMNTLSVDSEVSSSDRDAMGSESFDAEFAMALEGLSAPADPLAGKVGKAEAFAPERQAETPMTAKVFDDFDSLLASEMATLNLDKAATRGIEPTSAALIKGVQSGEHARFNVAAPNGADNEPLPRILSTFASDDSRVAEDERRAGARFGLGASGRKIAASVVVLALLGGTSMLVLGGGNGASDASAPLIVKADAEPVKIVPPNPGGKQVANQESATYEKVANGSGFAATQQDALVSAAEKPIDLQQEAPQQYEGLPGVDASAFAVAMSDARPESAEPTLQPRRVKTVTVLPDGTIVSGSQTESIEPTAALIAAASKPVDPRASLGGVMSTMAPDAAEATLEGAASLSAIEAMAAATDDLATASLDPAADATNVPTNAADAAMPVGEPAPNVPVPAMKPSMPNRQVAALETAPAPGAARSNDGSGPAAPVAAVAVPAGAADAPVAAAPTEVAVAPSGDAWYVQMSSQPTADAARSSANTISTRYANLVSGRQMLIQTADIPGKGTYHRVRLAASSRQEAIGLCEQLKSAGGSCFVAR
ncbi:SPOR domain-containing protein [Fulvimarina sp. 2208YS6-2-32]|uniref:SPOR domain-containing protein n=1 Tax=Fulvimarina uroteuthidis TaxID=3098149 RepID=A0ABU5I5W8_9HYPH|nr:SPOR domain-containing protein [Fulvimarina sp. 2208YS6-2-32]MDY8110606.1 SPOR domain-containing protein [Fulvimarina sp. 2208YS6-2-32]